MDFPSKFDHPNASPGFLLWHVSNLWQKKQREALAKLDLTHVQFVLLASITWLENQKKTITQNQLACFAQTDRMMTSSVVRTLEKKGLIMRIEHRTDKRAYSLQTSSKGQKLIQQALPLVEHVDELFFGSLGKKSAEMFLQLLADRSGSV